MVGKITQWFGAKYWEPKKQPREMSPIKIKHHHWTSWLKFIVLKRNIGEAPSIGWIEENIEKDFVSSNNHHHVNSDKGQISLDFIYWYGFTWEIEKEQYGFILPWEDWKKKNPYWDHNLSEQNASQCNWEKKLEECFKGMIYRWFTWFFKCKN